MPHFYRQYTLNFYNTDLYEARDELVISSCILIS